MRTEDGSIINECLSGKPQAFGMLVDKYKAGVYAYVCAEVRNFHDAQDITQEVFIQAYRDLRSLRKWEGFTFWLYRIAYTRCKKWIRTRSRRPDSEFAEDQDPKVLEKLSLDAYRDSQVDESLQEALDSLSDTYREVLMLHLLWRYDYQRHRKGSWCIPYRYRGAAKQSAGTTEGGDDCHDGHSF